MLLIWWLDQNVASMCIYSSKLVNVVCCQVSFQFYLSCHFLFYSWSACVWRIECAIPKGCHSEHNFFTMPAGISTTLYNPTLTPTLQIEDPSECQPRSLGSFEVSHACTESITTTRTQWMLVRFVSDLIPTCSDYIRVAEMIISHEIKAAAIFGARHHSCSLPTASLRLWWETPGCCLIKEMVGCKFGLQTLHIVEKS